MLRMLMKLSQNCELTIMTESLYKEGMRNVL